MALGSCEGKCGAGGRSTKAWFGGALRDLWNTWYVVNVVDTHAQILRTESDRALGTMAGFARQSYARERERERSGAARTEHMCMFAKCHSKSIVNGCVGMCACAGMVARLKREAFD